MKRFIFVVVVLLGLLAGCDSRKCYEGTANEYQRILCP